MLMLAIRNKSIHEARNRRKNGGWSIAERERLECITCDLEMACVTVTHNHTWQSRKWPELIFSYALSKNIEVVTNGFFSREIKQSDQFVLQQCSLIWKPLVLIQWFTRALREWIALHIFGHFSMSQRSIEKKSPFLHNSVKLFQLIHQELIQAHPH